MKTVFKIILPVLLLLFPVSGAMAREFFIEDRGHYINVPDDWDIIDITDERFTFADKAESAFLMMRYYPVGSYDNAGELYADVLRQLKAEGDSSPFLYMGMTAVLGDLTFSGGDFGFSGFTVCLSNSTFNLALVAFGDTLNTEYYIPFMLSALDSFSQDLPGRTMPGPVSQFLSDFPSSTSVLERVGFPDVSFRASFSEDGLAASMDIINREAILLSNYGNAVTNDAWIRYYRIIYRDNYQRLASYAGALYRQLGLRDKTDRETAELVLEWIQKFKYERPDNLADLISPVQAAFTSTGDCDARVLLYTILMHHYDIPCIMLVSIQHAHAIAGVLVDGSGARFPAEDGNGYVTAETTDNVALGLIAREMADPKGWVEVSFP